MTTLTLCVIKIGGIGKKIERERERERSKKHQRLNRCASLMDEAGEGEIINPKERRLRSCAHENPREGRGRGADVRASAARGMRAADRSAANPISHPGCWQCFLEPSAHLPSPTSCQPLEGSCHRLKGTHASLARCQWHGVAGWMSLG